MTTALLPEEPELGVQRFCKKCQSWWPDDPEFWHVWTRPAGTIGVSHGRRYVAAKPRITYVCRACRQEYRVRT